MNKVYVKVYKVYVKVYKVYDKVYAKVYIVYDKVYKVYKDIKLMLDVNSNHSFLTVVLTTCLLS